ncbi:MAG TPA: hypothetical protein VJ765_00200 [Chitinophagaceae bacterium]|nr:hypothetical protein [Chitinophagaceae bacterium]
MKNKIIYVFILIFSISLLSSAKKANGTCDKDSACSQMKKCKEAKKITNEEEFNLPSLGLFLFNI